MRGMRLERMKDSPCLNCQRRKLGCHATCDDYIQYDNERKKVRKDRLEEYNIENTYKTRYK